ncbi:MAG: AMMECR1 family protein [Candidatus Omnitrophica bacterium]|nr:AMMECR1 family protein [Candidatus Omnitrophota bacterium]
MEKSLAAKGRYKPYLLTILSMGLIFPVFSLDAVFSLCRKAIKHYLDTGQKIQIPDLSGIFQEKIPVFVSLRRGNQTRGCAGTFSAERSFAENLIDFSIIAATQDFRYRAIDEQELEEIMIQITIPGKPIEISSLASYNPESEGLVVEQRGRYGVVLPREARTAQYALKIALRNAGIDDVQAARLLKFKARIFLEGKK